MKILILSNKLPYPPRDGGSIATLNMMTGLQASGNEVTCLALNTSKHHFPVEKIPEGVTSKIRFFGVGCDTAMKPLNLIINLLFSTKPYIAERFNIRAYRDKLTDLLQHESFDIIQLEGPYTGHYVKEIRRLSKALLVLRAHNVEHVIWKRKIVHEKSPLKRWYLKNMAASLEKFELGVLSQSDCLISISPQDEAYFLAAGYDHPALTIPAGLILDDYPLTPLPPEPTIFFIGALDWLPNQEGITWFLEKVLPAIISEIPEIQFHVAGRNAPEDFESILQQPHIVYHGEVDDARLFMQKYRVMVAPLFTGSGIRIKILEGMAMGRPVVTTSVGIEGIPAENGMHMLVSDNPDQFKDQVVKLLRNEMEAQGFVSEARRFITHNFDTFGLSTRLSQFFNTQV